MEMTDVHILAIDRAKLLSASPHSHMRNFHRFSRHAWAIALLVVTA
jgi:hypothetical protein